MLDWFFKPSCPCPPRTKAWIEKRLAWLDRQFPESAFTGRPVILPTPEFFPQPFDNDESSVLRTVHKVCEWMDVDPDRINVRFVSRAKGLGLVNDAGHTVGEAAATYQMTEKGEVITIDRSGFGNTMALVGTIAHELSHARLMGENRIDPDIFDNEILTDLTVVHFGLGIFLANTPRVYQSQFTRWPNSKEIKPEYMSDPMFGWALALLAWFRGEDHPPWRKHLTFGAKCNLDQGIRFLKHWGHSDYAPG